MNYEQEYNKLFEYFLNRTQHKNEIKTCNELIEDFEYNNFITYTCLEDLTSIIEDLKIQLKELTNLNQEELQKKIEDMINLCETRKTIYCSENEESPEKPEGYIGAKILESRFSEVYSDEEEITENDEIPDW